jgi:sortase (surface protein transpeptidase)
MFRVLEGVELLKVLIKTFAVVLFSTYLFVLLSEGRANQLKNFFDTKIVLALAEGKPLAKIIVPGLNQEHYIYENISGGAIRLGPIWDKRSSPPAYPGLSIVTGDGKSHFSFLKELSIDDLILIDQIDGAQRAYKVQSIQVLQETYFELSFKEQENMILLSTTYPYSNFQIGKDMFYAVIASEVKDFV